MIKYKNEMEDYLYNHNYVSENKKSNYQQELSVERAECIINKHDNIVNEEKQQLISFIKERIKLYEEDIENSKPYLEHKELFQQVQNNIHTDNCVINNLKIIIDFVNKGGKE